MKITKCFNPRLNQYGYYMTDANGDIKALTYEDGLKQGMVMLEQIRAEIESRLQGVNITLEILVKDDALIPRMEAAKTTLEEVLEIIDKAIKEQNE